MAILVNNQTLVKSLGQESVRLANIHKNRQLFCRFFPFVSRIYCIRNEENLQRAKNLLETVQESMLDFLKPIMMFKDGDPESAFCALYIYPPPMTCHWVHHFISYVRHPSSEFWLVCNDLKPQIMSLQMKPHIIQMCTFSCMKQKILVELLWTPHWIWNSSKNQPVENKSSWLTLIRISQRQCNETITPVQWLWHFNH